MADFQTCFDFMQDNEDSRHLHQQRPDRCPAGCAGPCYAISGINSGAFPAQFATIAALPQADRGPAIQQFYQDEFWNRWLGGLTSTPLAMRVYDACVNQGAHTGVTELQQAINAVNASGPQIEEDGAWGPITEAAANACDPGLLLAAFQSVRYAHYQEHDAGRPELPALLARAMK
jgi:hypothetical protein